MGGGEGGGPKIGLTGFTILLCVSVFLVPLPTAEPWERLMTFIYIRKFISRHDSSWIVFTYI